ncbi:MAG: ParB/RepB/Spo0J family partition protein [Alphaproteobacteria bacterium]
MNDPKFRRPSLGRGLDALLGAKPEPPPATPAPAAQPEAAARIGGMVNLAIDKLSPGKYQPRHRFDQQELDSLVHSIRSKGVLTPVLVRPHPTQPGHYEIIAGERRWRAAQAAQLHELPAIVRDLSDRDTLEVALVENIQRQDLTAIEEAEGYKRLMDEFNYTQEQLANVIGRSRSHIANTLRLLALPDDVRAMVQSGAISAGHGRALITASDPQGLAKSIVDKGLSVRAAEQLAQAAKPPRKPNAAEPAKSTDTLALQRSITETLGLKVEIRGKGEGGELVIFYRTLEQLDDVLQKLGKEHA